ncbi:GntR family transcriptional regulator [Paenibacillus thiaminolyticus]|nr:GntR family transcriptional regulator [Paenibacillus thiaminolyticus]WII38433.1 GntR family transcriptional regulator [Paenibacillus thiaminolyticus]
MASTSLIQTAYDYIRGQIMLGEFMPGTLLSENELAETLNMSRTPVRAAVAQLEYEGLAVSLKNRGILVKELSMKEALDMIEIMYTFQLYALNHIESQGDRPDLKKLKE